MKLPPCHQTNWEIRIRIRIWVRTQIWEHDLAHGEFGKWLETIQMNKYMASRFIKVFDELPKLTTSSTIGFQALYEIATMPPDERDKPQQLSSGEVNTHSSVFQILGKLKFIEIIKRGVHFRHPLDT